MGRDAAMVGVLLTVWEKSPRFLTGVWTDIAEQVTLRIPAEYALCSSQAQPLPIPHFNRRSTRAWGGNGRK